MSLKVEGIEFLDFRNYEQLSLKGLGNLTVFTGKNAVGKTNILEGLQLLTTAHSFKNPQISQLIREGQNSARLSMACSDGNRRIETSLYLEKGKKRFTVNGKSKASSDIRGILPSVMFNPDDLQLAKKASSSKRDSIDHTGAQLSKSYYTVLQDYEKVIRYKGRLLRDEAPDDLIASINEMLITCGSQLFCYRKALFDRFVPLMVDYYDRLSDRGEIFSASYMPSWVEDAETHIEEVPISREMAKELIAGALKARQYEERARHRCLIGPHQDKICFMIGEKDVSDFASQGQQRSVVLAFKLAEVSLIEQTLGQHPILLLDDVMSELDEKRRDMLVSFVRDDIQTFVTATDLSSFNKELINRSQVIELPLERGDV